jgi:beta-xylosidase
MTKNNNNYKNPILYADYSDPDAIRVGEDYFMVASSFCNAPGLPLLHSKDLINWKVVNYVIDEIPEARYKAHITYAFQCQTREYTCVQPPILSVSGQNQ